MPVTTLCLGAKQSNSQSSRIKRSDKGLEQRSDAESKLLQAIARKSMRLLGLAIALLLPAGCSSQQSMALRNVPIQQTWQLQPGAEVAGRYISGGIGDVSVELAGGKVYAPFDGTLQPTQNNCLVFSSPEVPAYLLRFCGLRQTRLGDVSQGDPVGSGEMLQFATLRRQPDGQWAMVEPSISVLERSLQP